MMEVFRGITWRDAAAALGLVAFVIAVWLACVWLGPGLRRWRVCIGASSASASAKCLTNPAHGVLEIKRSPTK